jgi:hypothetical protein
MDVIVKVITAERDHAREICEAIIDSEQNYLFTNDQDYKDNRSEIINDPRPSIVGGDPNAPEDGSQGGPPGRERADPRF